MDFSVIYDSIPLYAQAALTTVRTAFIGIVLAFVFGSVCAVIKQLRIPILWQLVNIYIEFSRNTPLIVQLFFLYFGLPKLGIVLSSEACAIIGLTFLGGGYMAESLRAGLEAVDGIQNQSALSLGMTQTQSLRTVVFPQALAIAAPGITANVIFLIKETSVVSVVALADLIYVAKSQIGSTYDTREALFLLVVFYLIILLPTSLLSGCIERWLRHAAHGA
ncbi:glutamate ABC transport system permease [Corynebacterium kutscheri]|uniref:Amine acid ABC transporter, permease protein, 3-TM region, His/Glu/Gln/Arg/opine family n=1 Tax=Corynebacterium kutscheri TaxID=35755 RepID=A0A0F6QZT1_9CORY|nr:amino acid ABC transporter permease [Corynebacterium kutscheri]AKE40875.1 amine acid ABC transporter, permease protein, 3-TM region, His/Glu/Gln/Arg/opine family [Corynebacterium kutscheri]VEH06633.1 glutamate ABC transport system permease [Corynebacterium kutscheri]VEH09172.1 glutamate ABC transport system permease [Corynebacterium kutscheri]VEH82565.1 glutamate ABC transport system permease [Corynebacterium kutscheri]